MRKAGLPSPNLFDAISFCFLEDANYMICESNGKSADGLVESAMARAESLFADV